MAEGSDTDNTGSDLVEGWSKIRSRRNKKAQWAKKVAMSQQAQILSEWKGEGWDLFSPVLLVSLFLKLFGETLFRVAKAQGKQGIWLLTFLDRKNTENLVNSIFLHKENCANTGKILKI